MLSRTRSGTAFDTKGAAVLRWTGAAIIIGVVLAALGPFGSYMNGGPVQRACYWIAAMLLGLMLYGAAFRVATALAPMGSRLRWPVLIGMTLIASVPEALATRAGAFWLWPELARLRLSSPLWFAQTTMIGLIATIGVALVLRRSAPVPQAQNARSMPHSGSATWLADDILALQMEDHYVRVHRPGRSELVLMPLGRAIDSLRVEGLRTHRSWWVARHAVDSVEGTSRSMHLRLSNGIVAPVARTAVIKLRAAGWIAVREGDVGFWVDTKVSSGG